MKLSELEAAFKAFKKDNDLQDSICLWSAEVNKKVAIAKKSNSISVLTEFMTYKEMCAYLKGYEAHKNRHNIFFKQH